jgi:hypothetical protein
MERENEIRNEIRDVLAAGKLPTITVPRSLLSDVYQLLIASYAEREYLHGELDAAKDANSSGKLRQAEIWGHVMRIMRQHACECEEQCEVEIPIQSYCGWDAKQALEGKL